MASLSANEKSFVQMMGKSDEHARRGFELLLKRSDFLKFFDALIELGLFEASKNPAAVPVENGMVRIPYWPALDYLVACAKLSDETADKGLATKVLQIIRAVTGFREPEGHVRDNFHTFRKFAEILGILPPDAIDSTDVELVQQWLESKFDHDMVANALSEGALKRFLDSAEPNDRLKAVQLLRYCTAIRWGTSKRRGVEDHEPTTIVGEYWLKELISTHAPRFGRKIGPEAATVLESRVREIFAEGGRAEWSYVFRPAVGPDSQNHHGRGAEDCCVDGLRDVLLGWCDVDAEAANIFVDRLLHSDVEMLRRVGIYVMSERWESLRDLYPPLIGPELFDSGHLHELHGLLKKHFEGFSDAEKAKTVEAIRNPVVPEGEDSDRRLKRIQQRWLTALSGTSYEPAATFLAQLTSDLGSEPPHPNYHAYMESFWGPGPSPYQVQELVAFAEDESIVEKLNGFEPTSSFRGPNSEALADTLEQAVVAAPDLFLRALPKFIASKPQYQNGVLRGFKKLWDAAKDKQPTIDWDGAWVRLIDFFESLIGNDAFWEAEGKEDRASWIVDTMADMLHSAAEDGHAYPEYLLPRGWSLIQTLIQRAQAADELADDPMSQAINTSKGRSIEALFTHALRRCRLADKNEGSHADAWAEMKPVFESELEKCANGNYEFSTLTGAYFGNLEYIDSGWLSANLERIFPAHRPQNFIAALGGLAYSQPTRSGYRMLRDAVVLDVALRLELKGRETREKLVERIAIGYLWGEDALDSPRLSYLFEVENADDLNAVGMFFWSIRGEQLSDEQVSRIVAFWKRCVAWAQEVPEPPAELLSTLSGLASYLEDAAGQNLELLLAVAPYVHIHHHAYEFLEQLNRLVEVSPAEVSKVVETFIDAHEPFYDYKDRMKSLVGRLAELGCRPDALKYCEKLRAMPGLADLFQKLTAAS